MSHWLSAPGRHYVLVTTELYELCQQHHIDGKKNTNHTILQSLYLISVFMPHTVCPQQVCVLQQYCAQANAPAAWSLVLLAPCHR